MKELEMILTAVANLGAAGKEAFIWWLVLDKVVQSAFILAAVLGVPWMICRAVSKFNNEHLALESIAKELGMRHFYPDCSDDDYNLDGLMKRFREKRQS